MTRGAVFAEAHQESDGCTESLIVGKPGGMLRKKVVLATALRREGLDPRVAPELQANRDRKDLPEIKATLDRQGSQVIQAVVARKVILEDVVGAEVALHKKVV